MVGYAEQHSEAVRRLEGCVADMGERLSGLRGDQEAMKRELEGRMVGYAEQYAEAVRRLEGQIDGFGGETQTLSERLGDLDNRIQRQVFVDPKYFVFEDRFRGSSEDILARQQRYVQYFSNCRNVLDIGCGRGEFLDLLRENEIGGHGIDAHEDMVLFCQKKGLSVLKGDAAAYLDSTEDKTLDGIFMAQVVEHLVPSDLISLIGSACRTMKFGTYIVIETINPLSVYALVNNFCIDLSHVRPVHPQTLVFLLESQGFRDISVEYVSPVPPELRLGEIGETHVSSEELKSVVRSHNENIDKLNALLYSHQDYAIIARK